MSGSGTAGMGQSGQSGANYNSVQGQLPRSSYELEYVLRKKLEDARRNAADAVIQGFPDDFSKYREAVGYMRALDDIGHWIANIRNEVQKGD